jgi:chromosome segregation ATPase
MRASTCLVPLLALAVGCAAQSKASPIGKVVKLITEMKATAEKEQTSDKDAYDKYSCWSLTNEKEKKDAIAANTLSVQENEAFVEEAAGTSGQLAEEIKGLKSDIEEDEAALDSANEQREKENEAFQAEEADMKETIELLGQAVSTLSKVQLLQKKGQHVSAREQGAALVQIRQVVKRVKGHPKFTSTMQRDLFDVLGSLETVARKEATRQGSTLEAGALLGEVFLPKRDGSSLFQNLLRDDQKPNDLKGGAAGAKSYNSRSGAIFGILGEMNDQFKRDLGAAQKQDFTALVNFQKLSAAKTSEISAATKQKEMKEGQLADLQAKVAEAKESIDASNDALDSDNSFLQNLLKNRKKEDEEFAARSKIRANEIEALGATLEILTGDESRELFGKTVSFLQEGASTAAMERAQDHASKRAMERLMNIGKKHKNMALVALAVSTRLDAFTKVKESMSKMLGALQSQQKAEYAKWEECKKEIDETEDEIKEAKETQSDLGEKHQDLVNTVSELTASIDELASEVASMNVELKKASEGRKAENMLYQTSVSDQRATVHILNMALDKLKDFYNSKGSFVQRAAQPATDSYSKSSGAGGVMQLIQKIITDAESEAAELSADETSAQAAYAEFVRDTASSIETANKAIAEKEKLKASAKSEKSEVQGSQIANKGEIEKMNTLLAGTHQSCDFLLKFFDIRQKARSEEMDAINEATAILSGAKFK